MSGIYGVQHQIEYTTPGNYTWVKPPGIVMVYILCIGGGGAGGSNTSQTAGTNRAGGGGGGGGALSRGFFPALLLPDVLYITVGAGATGQVGGAGVNSPTASVVKPYGDTNQGVYITGQPGNSANGSTFGAGGSAATVAQQSLGSFGILPAATSGFTGLSATAGAAGSNNALFAGILNAGGCSGGGITSLNVAQNGGSLTCTNPDIIKYSGGIVSTSPEGKNGVTSLARGFGAFYSTPGTGGAGSTTGAGGTGGNGGIGCGGGGSGANTASSASRGGNGGNGYVLIQCI